MSTDRITRNIVVSVAVGLVALVQPSGAQPDRRLPAESERIISQYKAVMEAPPQRIPSRTTPDAPLLGNGDLCTAIGGAPDNLQFWVMKNNFSKLRSDHRKGGPRPFGGLDVTVPALKGGTWHTEQDIFPAITTGRFSKDGTAVTMRTFVAATDALLIVELVAEGAPVDVSARLWPIAGRGSKEQTGRKDVIQWATKAFLSGPEGGTHPSEIPTFAGCAVKVMGALEPAFGMLPGQTATGIVFKLQPGKPVTLALAMQSNFDAKDPLETALEKVAGLTPEKVKVLEQKHRQWWIEFWSKSLVEFSEPFLQKMYYISSYVQGSAMRDKDFPPGLFGPWTTHDDPCWAGDYHLNFDYQSQYYALYKCNLLEQADTFEQPILDFMERGKYYAKECLGIRGVYYPVGIWAKGMETSRQPTRVALGIEKGGVFLGQKTNAAYCLANMAMRWFHTYCLDYARKVYPFVLEVANFWEDYLQYEPFDKTGLTISSQSTTNAVAPVQIVTINGVPVNKIPVSQLPPGRYVVANDSIHENIHTGGDADRNSLLSLGLVHNTFTLVLDMSKELGVDQDRRERWQHILKNLSKFPTFEKDGKTVFRYTEKGTEWVDGNSVGLQHIYPGGAIGLDDDPKLVEIGRNTVGAKGRPWNNDNGENSHYPAAVRVGYDPDTILKNLNLLFSTSRKSPNGLVDNTEQCSTLPNTINEMICMSHRQVLRLFPVWPKNKDVRFWNLRAEGAFLVSSALKDGAVQFVKIHSEKGRDCTVVNPWPGKAVDVYRDGKKVGTLTGERLTMKTESGATVVLGPEGKGCPQAERDETALRSSLDSPLV